VREALATAVTVRLPEGASVVVTSLPALALLKVWAWKERKYIASGKDASDLWTLLRHYADTGNEERLYGSEGEALASFGFDIEKAGAWLLGRDARGVLAHGPDPAQSLASLDAILRPEVNPDGSLRLVAQMPPGDRDVRSRFLLPSATASRKSPPRADTSLAPGVDRLTEREGVCAGSSRCGPCKAGDASSA
jgi:hypothetical protein